MKKATKQPKRAKQAASTGISEAFPVTGGAPLVAVPPGVGVAPAPPGSAPAPASPAAAPALAPAPSGQAVKLDLGSGQNPRDGFEGVDLYAPNAKHKFNLLTFPWPLADNSVDELHCSHFIEHIPTAYVTKVGDKCEFSEVPISAESKDLFFAFFDECFRVLKPDGMMTVIAPAARTNRAFQDPTHRRFIVAEMFCYLSAEWRKQMKLDHYRVDCNFLGNVTHTMFTEEAARNSEAQNHRFNHYWNTILDFHCTMKAVKTAKA